MSHSNQCEDAKCQQKLDTEREEARMQQVVLCFWCDQLPLVTVEGISLCADHARCVACGRFVTHTALMCRCDRYGAYGHEELVYCSEGCLDSAHEWGRFEQRFQAEESNRRRALDAIL